MEPNGDLKYAHLYDNISAIYEHALASSQHKHTQTALNLISTFLKPRSSILDVACGTGKPISAHFAANGYDVTGIDYSSGMLEIARTAVPNATFLQAEMTSWEPPDGRQYDLVIASHCFFNFSVAQIRAMIYKLSHWARKDGIVVIGSSYDSKILECRGVQVDHRGWAEGFPTTFLDQEFAESSMGRLEAWVDLIKSTGLEIINIDHENAMLVDGGSGPEMRFYIITRRSQVNPLIGPFPLPDTVDSPVTIQPKAWRELIEKMETDMVNKTIRGALREGPSCCKVLCVSKLSIVPLISGIEIQQSSELPSSNVQPGSFDGVILHWVLHLVSSPGDYIDHAIKAILPTGNARIIVVQAAPDNELTNLINEASEGLGLPIQHHGSLLNEAESKFRAAGFQNINYIRTQGSINKFCSLPEHERAKSAANLLSGVFTTDEALHQAKFKERLKDLLKIHFLFKYSGEITCQTTILVAERK